MNFDINSQILPTIAGEKMRFSNFQTTNGDLDKPGNLMYSPLICSSSCKDENSGTLNVHTFVALPLLHWMSL